MKPRLNILRDGALFLCFLAVFGSEKLHACSTFKLQKGNELLYGHNLNQPGMNVPGLVFINKRGVFKVGRSWSEMITKNRSNPSTLSWISRYGSVTFSTFGKDMPDGGMNEAGLYIWEMNDETEYPKNESLPKLIQMNWMQYVLDNFSTLDEAVVSASNIEIGGSGWHYFLGDLEGHCASVEFIKGEVVVHRGNDMPVPALFNEPYAREIGLAGFFKGFGGLYEPDLNEKRVPRFVKTAVMIRDYDPSRDAVAYGLDMLDRIKVNEVPDWSVLIDVRRRNVYFKTFLNQDIKKFSLDAVDFSNKTPAMVLNIDQKEGGDVAQFFRPLADGEIGKFISSLPLPKDFFAQFEITKDDFVERFATHDRAAEDPARQYFKGIWKTKTDGGKKPAEDNQVVVEFKVAGSAVTGEIRNSRGENYLLDHLHLVNKSLSFTFRNRAGTFYVADALLENDKMDFRLWGIDGLLANYTLYKQ
jgi:penicillin V acylase-like amidase (Ntn superfamily)